MIPAAGFLLFFLGYFTQNTQNFQQQKAITTIVSISLCIIGCCLCCAGVVAVALCAIVILTPIIVIYLIVKLVSSKYEHEKKEIFHKLLEGGSVNSETETPTQNQQPSDRVDMSLFNLDFKDYKIVKELSSFFIFHKLLTKFCLNLPKNKSFWWFRCTLHGSN